MIKLFVIRFNGFFGAGDPAFNNSTGNQVGTASGIEL